MELVLKAGYFALPAFFAGIVPVLLAKLKWFEFLNKPVDFNGKIGNEFIFGNHKTWRGLIFAPIAGIAVAYIQLLLYANPSLRSISILNYNDYWLLFGALAGLGAIIGDLVKSFFKRRFKIGAGKPWPVFDQIDSAVGFLAFTYAIAWPDLAVIFIILILALVVSPVTNIAAYFLGIKKVWW